MNRIHRFEEGTRIHPERSAAQLCILCFLTLAVAFLVSPVPGRAAGNIDTVGDAARGKELFEKRCAGCHALDFDKEGPRLRNVYGRKAGSIPTFKYSDTLKSAQITWDESSLDKWLTDTETLIPDNDMDFHVPKADERADIIRFLRVSSGK